MKKLRSFDEVVFLAATLYVHVVTRKPDSTHLEIRIKFDELVHCERL